MDTAERPGERTAFGKRRARAVGAGSRPAYRRRTMDAAVMVAASSLFLATALLIDGDRTVGVEARVFDLINGLPGWLYPVLWLPMQLGNLVAVPAAAIAAAAVRKWRLAAAVVLSGAGKWVVSAVVKDVVVRHRPGSFVENITLRGDTHALGQAFVSGHAIIAAGLATIAHPYLGTRGRILAWTGVAIVCFGRLYVGAHLPLDVIGGAAVGVAVGSLLNLSFGVPAPSSKRVQDPVRDR